MGQVSEAIQRVLSLSRMYIQFHPYRVPICRSWWTFLRILLLGYVLDHEGPSRESYV